VARTRLYAQLEARIKEEAEKALADMGEARCKDYPAYLYQCGYLRGMREVIEYMDEIENQRE
jgi:uncharacterized lipoprotein YehR (DUF1307 family)